MAPALSTRESFSVFPKDCIGILRRLDSPNKIQDYLDNGLEYNEEQGGDTCLSVLEVLKRGRAHCIEGAMLAAAARLYHEKPALLLDLRANESDDDHVIMPFKEDGKWGAVAQSHFMGLGFREPIHSSTAELARSYFELYYDVGSAKKTLREYSVPLDVCTLKPDWLYSRKDVFYVSKALDKVRHYDVLSGFSARRLRPADSRLLSAEKLLRAQSKK
ncbi:MAG: hypothetical protein WCX64_06190 [Candidatus Micrarchaeia archaeon]